MMKKIVLIGFACCGKSVVGKLLADRLGYAFVDTDCEVQRHCNLTISEIFERQGEESFRQMESELLASLADRHDTVVSCGGGSALANGFDRFAANSVVVWLTATAQTVLSRLGDTPRPLFDKLSERELAQYVERRSAVYQTYAGVQFATDGKTPEQLAEEIYSYICKN